VRMERGFVGDEEGCLGCGCLFKLFFVGSLKEEVATKQ
jgi:hypothetical protein